MKSTCYLIVAIGNALLAGWAWNRWLELYAYGFPVWLPISQTVATVILLVMVVLRAISERKKE